MLELLKEVKEYMWDTEEYIKGVEPGEEWHGNSKKIYEKVTQAIEELEAQGKPIFIKVENAELRYEKRCATCRDFGSRNTNTQTVACYNCQRAEEPFKYWAPPFDE